MSDQTFAADELSFDEFTRPTYDEWYAAALDSIGGADFEKLLTTRTYEGLTLQPLYRREDLAPIAHLLTLPGFTPFVRGVRASGHVAQPWLIAQELPAPTPEAFNAALRHDLAQGQNAIKLILDQPGRAGLDPDQAENPGQGGLSLASLDDVAQAFAGIDLSALPLHAEAGASFLPLLALLAAYYQQQGQSLADWRGSITADPLGELVQNGTLPAPLEKLYDEMAQITAWAVQNAPQLATIGIACVPYHNGGANAVQELAFAIATGVEYLREMLVRDLTIELAAPRMIFSFAIGAQFFIEIAKLRAARLLWSRVIGAFGGSESAQRMRLHTCTGRLNKTVYDPYVNILRTTLEAFAGVIGGSDSLHIAPFDESANLPDEFSRRIARNQHLILQHEAGVSRTIDPASGSYFVEVLTDSLAQSAWTLFQEIETQGGMFRALEAGFAQEQIAQVAARRTANIEQRRDVLVGINMYPNPADEPIATRPAEVDAAGQSRARAIIDYRARTDTENRSNALDSLRSAAPQARVEAAIAAAQAGATLNEISRALRPMDAANTPAVMPVPALRLAEPFEVLRRNAANYRHRTGTPPRIFLANSGSYRARADFVTGFFEVGGFEVLDHGSFATPEAAAQAAVESGAPAVVICSTDDAYPSLVPPLVHSIRSQKPDTIVLLAGYPPDQIEAHKAAGIDAFVHIRANCCEMNRWLQQQIGVSS